LALLNPTFVTIAEYKLKPAPEKRVSEIEVGKFLGFLLTERGMEVNPEMCVVTRHMALLSGFASTEGEGGLPYQECKEAFIRLKEYLLNPPVMCKLQPSTPLSLYLAVIDQAIISILV